MLFLLSLLSSIFIPTFLLILMLRKGQTEIDFSDENVEKLPRLEEANEQVIDEPIEHDLFRKLAGLQRNPASDEKQSAKLMQDDVKSIIFNIRRIIANPESLIDWCVITELVSDRRKCPTCDSPTEWRILEDDKEYWVCCSEAECEITAVNNTGFFEGMRMRKLVFLLFIWIRGKTYQNLVTLECITEDDFTGFNDNMDLVCIYACQKLSQKIGGRRVRVYVEITCSEKDQTMIIAGKEDRDPKKFFAVYLDHDNITAEYVKERLRDYIKPGSFVFTTTTIKIVEEFKWHYCGMSGFEFSNSLCLSLWLGYLSLCQSPMFELTKTTGMFCREFSPQTHCQNMEN